MPVPVTWPQALAWRMRRQLLDPVGELPVAAVVRRLCGVQAQVASSAELAVRFRRQSSRPGEVGRALAEGRLIKTWAMRGALHLLTPEEGGAFLSLIAAQKSWELPSWQRYFGMTNKRWDTLRAVVGEALDGPPLTRDELVAAIVAKRGLGHLGDELRSGWGTLFKPLAWQGELCYGPSQGTRVTFTRPDLASRSLGGRSRPGGGRTEGDPRLPGRIRAGDDRQPPQLAGPRQDRGPGPSVVVRLARRPAGGGPGGR